MLRRVNFVLALESLVDHLECVTDHVVSLLQGPERCQNLVIDTFREEYLLKGVELLNLRCALDRGLASFSELCSHIVLLSGLSIILNLHFRLLYLIIYILIDFLGLIHLEALGLA